MGVINAENLLEFKSSESLFARIKKRLSSYDSMGLIDDGDFHKHVAYILEALGVAVYGECEAVLHVKNGKAKMPPNFKLLHAAYRCTFTWKGTKSINEQKPWIFYTDTEITQQCPPTCTLSCVPQYGKTKIVIRTFVNGEESSCGTSSDPCLLTLSPNVKDVCAEDCLNIFCPGPEEISIVNGYIQTTFDKDSIYMQYYGLPVDEFDLPMIPKQEHIEKAIEYYIYSTLFEEWYWNSTIPDIARMLADVRQQYDFHIGMAISWVKLPSFQSVLQSIRKQRTRKKFYYTAGDRTIN